MPPLDPSTIDTRRYVGERVTVVRGFSDRLHGELRYFERSMNDPSRVLVLVALDEPEPGIGVQVVVPLDSVMHDDYHDRLAAARGEVPA